MNIDEMRKVVKGQYVAANGWHQKVDKMSDSQVAAIYFRIIESERKRNA